MHNSFPEPSPILMSERMSQFFSFESNSESEFKFLLSNFHIPRFEFLNQFQLSISKIFQTLSSNLFDLNL
jgi:hypothetical protein